MAALWAAAVHVMLPYSFFEKQRLMLMMLVRRISAMRAGAADARDAGLLGFLAAELGS